MADSEKMPIAIYRLDPPEKYEGLDFQELTEGVIGELNKKKKKKADGLWTLQSTSVIPREFEMQVYSSFRRTPPKWTSFLEPALAQNSTLLSCINTTYSFIAFISYEEETYAVTGGSGSLALDFFVSQTFGLDILIRLIKKESQVIKAIQEREVTGIILVSADFTEGISGCPIRINLGKSITN
jgi:uncharacterized protein (TIGR04141 family)